MATKHTNRRTIATRGHARDHRTNRKAAGTIAPPVEETKVVAEPAVRTVKPAAMGLGNGTSRKLHWTLTCSRVPAFRRLAPTRSSSANRG